MKPTRNERTMSNKHTPGLIDSVGRSNNRKLPDKDCIKCGKQFRPARSSASYCSIGCARKKNGGHNKKPETWWRNQKGYIEGKIWLPNGVQIRVKRHRFVMEGIIGRPLHAWEDVHHKNGKKDDNSPENLEIIAHSDHARLSNSKRNYKRGYKLKISDESRTARSLRAIENCLSEKGRAAIQKATKP